MARRSGGQLLADDRFHPLHDLVKAEIGSIHGNGICRWFQRAVLAIRVALIAPFLLGEDLFERQLELHCPSPERKQPVVGNLISRLDVEKSPIEFLLQDRLHYTFPVPS